MKYGAPIRPLLLAALLPACSGGIAGEDGAPGDDDDFRNPDAPKDAPVAILDEGRVTLRRLNRTEYNNTVRDLLGTDLAPADQFPGDDVDHGFDTLGSAIRVAPVHLELMEAAAFSLVEELLKRPAQDVARQRILVCDDPGQDCLRRVLVGFLPRAFRRVVDDQEIDDLLALARKVSDETGQADDGRLAALSAVLVSPHFLFRIERDADLSDTEARRISNHELAARLSYFLWSTMPDEDLFAAADEGRLSDRAVLGEQIDRMLGDARADALARHFAGQWLFTRSIEEFQPEKAAFPDFDPALRDLMKEETELFFSALIDDNAPVADLLTAHFTLLNDRLAAHYDLPAPGGAGFQRVSLQDTERGGLLTQGSMLLVTSQPNRTSPVKRGKWVLHQLMCAPPPPPPPMVENLVEPARGDGQSLRAVLEQHRAEPACAGCHRIIDPIGLGLEKFDGVGVFRTHDNGVPVDATGEMPDGQTFDGAAELSSLLVQGADLGTCVSRQMLTYGLGRAFESGAAEDYVKALALQTGGQDARLGDLVKNVILSQAFQTRRANVPE